MRTEESLRIAAGLSDQRFYALNMTTAIESIQDVVDLKEVLEESRLKKNHQEEFPMDRVSSIVLHRSYQELRQAVVRAGMSSEEPYSTFYCPLTKDIMKDPVMTASNQTYEREAIKRWFDEGHNTDPCTMQPLVDTSLTSNKYLQQTIREWRERDYVVQILKAKDGLVSSNEEEQVQVLEILSELCEKSSVTKDWIAFEGLIPQIVGCLRSQSCSGKNTTFGLLKVLVAGNDENKEKVTGVGCLELATRCLLRDRTVIQAAEFLGELAKSGGVLNKLAQQEGAILSLVTCFMTAEDAAVKQIVRLILEQLSDTDENVKQMAEANWCTPLVERLCKGVEKSRVAMAVALAEMTLTDQKVEAFVCNGVISPLVKMIQSRRCETEDSAIQALRNLSSHEIAVLSMVAEGAIPLILESFSAKKSLTFKVAAAAILENLTLKHGVSYLEGLSLKHGVSYLEGLTKLVHDLFHLLGNLTLRITPTSLHVHVLGALYGMASPRDAIELRQLIRDEEGCLAVLLMLFKTKVPQVCVLALKLLLLLCDGKEGAELASSLLEDLELLMDLLKDDSVSLDVHMAAAGMLATLPQSGSRHRVLLEVDRSLSTLVRMAGLPNVEAKESAVGALVRFTEAENLQQSLVDMGLLPILVEMLTSTSPLLKMRAAVALKNFSLATPQLSHRQKKLSTFSFKGLRVCRVHNMKCSVKTTFCMLEAGAVPKLVEVLGDPSSEVAEAALDALATLLQTENMIEKGAHVLKSFRAVDELLRLVTSNSLSCSGKSLELLEMIFKVAAIKKEYGLKARMALLSLTGCCSPSLSRKASRMLAELDV